jgi:hypothetical protein
VRGRFDAGAPPARAVPGPKRGTGVRAGRGGPGRGPGGHASFNTMPYKVARTKPAYLEGEEARPARSVPDRRIGGDAFLRPPGAARRGAAAPVWRQNSERGRGADADAARRLRVRIPASLLRPASVSFQPWPGAPRSPPPRPLPASHSPCFLPQLGLVRRVPNGSQRLACPPAPRSPR